MDGEIDRPVCRERSEAEESRWTVWEKKRLNDNFIDFVHHYEEEIGDPTELATSVNESIAWEVRRLKAGAYLANNLTHQFLRIFQNF